MFLQNQVYPAVPLKLIVSYLRSQECDKVDIIKACYDIVGHGLYRVFTKRDISPNVVANLMNAHASYLTGLVAANVIENELRTNGFPPWIIALCYSILKDELIKQ